MLRPPPVYNRPTAGGRWLTKLSILLLLMKVFGNAFENQVATFSIDTYVMAHNASDVCTRLPYEQRTVIYCTSMVLVAAAAFLLPTLGGLISDKHFGCVRVLSVGCTLQFWASIIFPIFIWLSLFCHSHLWYYLIVAALALCIGMVDPLLVYGLMRCATDRRSRQLLVHAYFIAACATEILGFLPSVLRFAFRKSTISDSFEGLGVFCTVSLLICLFILTSDNAACEMLANDSFQFPRFARLRRYYIIVSAFIPFVAAMLVCRNLFYWKELKYYTSDAENFVSIQVPIIGYEIGTIVCCLTSILLILNNRYPRRLAIRTRIRLGLLLMISSKLILFVLSFFHTTMSQLGQSLPIAVQSIYFSAAFIDGAANGLTDVAMYELVDCITERCAKAMYIGIFYTTWGMGLFVTGIIEMLLRLLPSEGPHLMPGGDVQPQFYIRYSIVIFLLLLSYAYFAKVSLPLSENLILISLEQETLPVTSTESGISDFNEDS